MAQEQNHYDKKPPCVRPDYGYQSPAQQVGRDAQYKRPVYHYDAPEQVAEPVPEHTSAPKQEDAFSLKDMPQPPRAQRAREEVFSLSDMPQKNPAAKPQRTSAQPPRKQASGSKRNSATRKTQKRAKPQQSATQQRKRNDMAPLSYGEAQYRRRRRKFWAGGMVLLLLVCGIFFSFHVLFKVRDIQVTGEVPYESGQVISSFGVQNGDNLYSFDTIEAQQNLMRALPYLETVTIKRSMPDRIEIACTPAQEYYAFSTPSGWVVLSSSFKALRIATELPPNVIVLLGVEPASVEMGTSLAFVNEEHTRALQALTSALLQEEMTGVSEIDLTNTLKISFLYQNRVRVCIGTSNEVPEKLSFAKYLLEENATDTLAPDARGTLDVSDRNAEGRLQAVWSEGGI